MLKTFFICLAIQHANSLNSFLRSESILYGLSSMTEKNENATQCEQDLNLLFESIDAGHVWSLKALDASGQPGTGFIYGNNLWIGSHRQCMDISNKKPFMVNYDKIKHANQTPYDYPPYAMGFYMFNLEHNNTLQYHFQLPLEFTIQIGLCLPKSCSPENLEELFKNYLKEKFLNIQKLYDFNLQLLEIRLLVEDGFWLLKKPTTISLLIIVGGILVLSIIGTIYDVRQRNILKGKNITIALTSVAVETNISKDSPIDQPETKEKEESIYSEVLRCFSLHSSSTALFKTKLSEDTIPMIHGVRFLAIFWTIVAHVQLYAFDYVENMATGARLMENPLYQIITNAAYCVDTFFFLSGFLQGYLFFKYNDQNASLRTKISNYFLVCLNRLVRLSPTYLIVLLFTNVTYTYFKESSSLSFGERNDINCVKYWWRNMLYINNLFPITEYCMSWSWYLAIDTQSFLIMHLLLTLSTSVFKFASFVTVIILINSIIVGAYKAYTLNYVPWVEEQLRTFDELYDVPWIRIGPYIVGVIAAYILVVKMNYKLVLKKRTKIILWLTIPWINIWILFSTYYKNFSIEYYSFYVGTSRTLWGVGVAWMVIACCTGNARLLNKFLSFKFFIPLSRMTYCAYLLNPLVIVIISNELEATVVESGSANMFNLIGPATIVFLMSYIFTILFELPFIRIVRVLRSRRKMELKNNKSGVD